MKVCDNIKNLIERLENKKVDLVEIEDRKLFIDAINGLQLLHSILTEFDKNVTLRSYLMYSAFIRLSERGDIKKRDDIKMEDHFIDTLHFICRDVADLRTKNNDLTDKYNECNHFKTSIMGVLEDYEVFKEFYKDAENNMLTADTFHYDRADVCKLALSNMFDELIELREEKVQSKLELDAFHRIYEILKENCEPADNK